MNLLEMLEKLRDVQYQAAVYDELATYLQKCLDEDIEIPVDIEDGRVPEESVRAVLQQLADRRASLLDKLELAEAAEVTGVKSADFSIE
tara:strand:- start:2749 stop:3015 length:267 start_codon:yes stop_codon:yes gene_type:complete